MSRGCCMSPQVRRHESVAQERGTIAQKMSFGLIDEENPLYSILGFQGHPVYTLCRRGEEGTDEFSDVYGHY